MFYNGGYSATGIKASDLTEDQIRALGDPAILVYEKFMQLEKAIKIYKVKNYK